MIIFHFSYILPPFFNEKKINVISPTYTPPLFVEYVYTQNCTTTSSILKTIRNPFFGFFSADDWKRKGKKISDQRFPFWDSLTAIWISLSNWQPLFLTKFLTCYVCLLHKVRKKLECDCVFRTLITSRWLLPPSETSRYVIQKERKTENI